MTSREKNLILSVENNAGNYAKAILDLAYHFDINNSEVSISDGHDYGVIKIHEDDSISYDDVAITLISDYNLTDY